MNTTIPLQYTTTISPTAAKVYESRLLIKNVNNGVTAKELLKFFTNPALQANVLRNINELNKTKPEFLHSFNLKTMSYALGTPVPGRDPETYVVSVKVYAEKL